MADLVVALDFPDVEQAVGCADALRGIVPWVKVGLELFSIGGPELVRIFKSQGFKVFLDLKLHDIPNTVKGAALACAAAGADMMTLHLAGGERMCRDALEAVAGLDKRPLLFGVTVLTSLSEGELPCWEGGLSELARKLSGLASVWGLDGVVCSGHEASRIKAEYPNLQCLTPGIRLGDGQNDDQRRIMTPAQAVSAGSDFLVVGRPITRAEDPASAASKVLADMGRAIVSNVSEQESM